MQSTHLNTALKLLPSSVLATQLPKIINAGKRTQSDFSSFACIHGTFKQLLPLQSEVMKESRFQETIFCHMLGWLQVFSTDHFTEYMQVILRN